MSVSGGTGQVEYIERDPGTDGGSVGPQASATSASSAWGAPDPAYPCYTTSAGFSCACPGIEIATGDPGATDPPTQAIIPYSTASAFDALAVGRWKRTAGNREMDCEQVGVEITADHYFHPLAVASDGTVRRTGAAHLPWIDSNRV